MTETIGPSAELRAILDQAVKDALNDREHPDRAKQQRERARLRGWVQRVSTTRSALAGGDPQGRSRVPSPQTR